MAARGSLGQPGEPNLRYPTIELNEAESWQWSPAERLSRCFGVQPLRQTRQIDDDALMRAGADRFCLVSGADGELDAAAVDVRHLGLADDPHPERRRRQMAHIDARPDGALSRIEIRFDRIERRILHDHDHDRRRQHRRQRRVLELIGEVLGPHEQFEAALGADRYLFHRGLIASCARRRLSACPRYARSATRSSVDISGSNVSMTPSRPSRLGKDSVAPYCGW